jgi:hypothetical protein
MCYSCTIRQKQSADLEFIVCMFCCHICDSTLYIIFRLHKHNNSRCVTLLWKQYPVIDISVLTTLVHQHRRQTITQYWILASELVGILKDIQLETCNNRRLILNHIQSNLSKPNPFRTEQFVQFRQVFGLDRFKLHRHLVDGTVKAVWFRQVFGLFRGSLLKTQLWLWNAEQQ